MTIDIKYEREKNAERLKRATYSSECSVTIDCAAKESAETINRLLDEIERLQPYETSFCLRKDAEALAVENTKLRAIKNQLQQELAARPER